MYYGSSYPFYPSPGQGLNSSSSSSLPWGSMINTGLSGISSLLGGNMSGSGQMQNYAQQGIDASNQGYNQAQGYLQPYQQGGQQAYGQYQDWLGQMQNPTQYYNNVMDSYSMSPAAQFQLEQGTQAANNSAAAAGNIGTPAAQKALMRYSQGLANQDMQNYFNNVQGISNLFGGGLNTLNQMGYGASNQMANNSMMNSQQIAQLLQNLGMAGAYGQQQQGAGIGGFLGSIGGIASLF